MNKGDPLQLVHCIQRVFRLYTVFKMCIAYTVTLLFGTSSLILTTGARLPDLLIWPIYKAN